MSNDRYLKMVRETGLQRLAEAARDSGVEAEQFSSALSRAYRQQAERLEAEMHAGPSDGEPVYVGPEEDEPMNEYLKTRRPKPDPVGLGPYREPDDIELLRKRMDELEQRFDSSPIEASEINDVLTATQIKILSDLIEIGKFTSFIAVPFACLAFGQSGLSRWFVASLALLLIGLLLWLPANRRIWRHETSVYKPKS